MKTKHISRQAQGLCIALMRTLMAICRRPDLARWCSFSSSMCCAKGMPQHHLGSCSPPRPATCPGTIGILPDILNTIYIVHGHPGHRPARWAWARPST